MKIINLAIHQDDRGLSMSCKAGLHKLPINLKEAHCATIGPGKVRGNHFHSLRTEFIILFHQDKCEIAWDLGENTAPISKQFSGTGILAIETIPLRAHAIKNTGTKDIFIVTLSNFQYTSENPDTEPRKILHPD